MCSKSLVQGHSFTCKSINQDFFLLAGTIFNSDELLEFAKFGCYCEYDLFGIETSHYQLQQEKDMPNDANRIAFIRVLVEGGYGDRVVVAHDLHTKHRLVSHQSYNLDNKGSQIKFDTVIKMYRVMM